MFWRCLTDCGLQRERFCCGKKRRRREPYQPPRLFQKAVDFQKGLCAKICACPVGGPEKPSCGYRAKNANTHFLWKPGLRPAIHSPVRDVEIPNSECLDA